MTRKVRSVYCCAECGHQHPKWVGRCDGCGAWNSVTEEPVVPPEETRRRRSLASPLSSSSATPRRLIDVETPTLARWHTGLEEFDFVLGGGIVPGSLILIGGEPGIGKSTLLLQAAARLHGRPPRGSMATAGRSCTPAARNRQSSSSLGPRGSRKRPETST
jgi:DNA repair protein RadA/Sms